MMYDDLSDIPIPCDLCGATVPTLEHAMEEGWEPSYWIDEETHGGGPVCPECSAELLTDQANDPILRELTDAEVEAALARRGIDVGAAFERIKAALAMRRENPEIGQPQC